MKLVVFDLDDTLAAVGHQIESDVVSRLNALSEREAKFVICSGKPAYYIVGLARQCQFKDGIFIGENGAYIQFGISLPPVEYYELPFNTKILSIYPEIKDKISKKSKGSGIWFQPSAIDFGVFFKNESGRNIIAEVLAEYDKELKENAVVFETYDSFDIVPAGLNKGYAIKFLASKLGVDKSDIIAVGNGENDISMYKNAGMSVGVNQDYRDVNHHSAKNIREALDIVEAAISRR